MKTIISEKTVLTEAAIDDFSFELQMTLKKLGCKKQDILKARLAVEDALFQWLERGLRDQPLEVELVKKMRKYIVNLTVPGLETNPLMEVGDDLTGAELHGFLSNITQQINFAYTSGENIITLRIDGPSVNHFVWIILAIVMAAICGMGIRTFFPDQVSYIATGYVTPTFEMLLGLLTAVVAPYVFLSLVAGIITMGDPKQLNLIGKQVMGTFMGALAVVMLIVGALAVYLVPIPEGSSLSASGFFLSLWSLILRFFPTNMITAFADKRMMQIIVMAVTFGIAIVYMRESMNVVVKLILSLEKLFSSILRFICSFESILIFFGLLKVSLEDFSGVTQLAAFVIGSHIAIYALVFCLLTIFLARFVPGHAWSIMKKMLKPASIGLATASSTAAFPEVLSCCEKKLGIKHQLVVFAVPFGQVIFKIGSGIRLFLITLLCMYFYNLPYNVFAILLLGFLAYMLSMMVPPVAEGSVAALTLLFTYMQVPVDVLAVGIMLSVFVDFASTFINIYSNQLFILTAALRMDMLDKEKLFKP
jgi:Na+/H+-dicarboxylate symporter